MIESEVGVRHSGLVNSVDDDGEVCIVPTAAESLISVDIRDDWIAKDPRRNIEVIAIVLVLAFGLIQAVVAMT